MGRWALIVGCRLAAIGLVLAVAVLAIAAALAGPLRAQVSDDLAALNARVMDLIRSGQTQQSIEVVEKHVSATMHKHGAEDVRYGRAVAWLALVYDAAHRYVEAEAHHRKALGIYERGLGPEHSNVGARLNRLASNLQSQGRIAEAEPHYRRALAIYEKAPSIDPEHLVVAIGQLAVNYHRQGRYYDAHPFFQRALQVAEQSFSAQSLAVAAICHDLGVNLGQMMGKLGEAEAALRRALAIRQDHLGAFHERTAHTGISLAANMVAQGRYEEGIDYLRQAMPVLEKTLGTDHLEIADALDRLGDVLRAQGLRSDAIPLLRRSLDIRTRALGQRHAALTPTMRLLAVALRSNNELVESQQLLLAARGILEKAAPNNSVEYAHVQHDLGVHAYLQGRLVEAEALYRQALETYEKANGGEHLFVASALLSLGEVEHRRSAYDAAEGYYRRAVAIRERRLGTSHPDVIQALARLGLLLLDKRDASVAYDVYRRATAAFLARHDRPADHASLGRDKSLKAELTEYRVLLFYHAVSAHNLALLDATRKQFLLDEAFQLTQRAANSDTARAVAKMAARAASDATLGRLVREREDIVAKWQTLDNGLIAIAAQPDSARKLDVEEGERQRLAALQQEIRALDNRLDLEFPDYAVLASDNPLKISEVQALLKPGEVLIKYFLSHHEGLVVVVTPTEYYQRGIKLEIGALTREVDALRCGLDATVWTVPADAATDTLADKARKATQRMRAEACLTTLGTAPNKDAAGRTVLPFDSARAHKLYRTLFGEVEDLIKGKHLLIVSSGPLQQLPFQVLVTKPPADGGDKRSVSWLARDHAITVLPAVSSLKALRRVAKSSHADRPMIGFGNPLLDGPDARYAERAKAARAYAHCRETVLQRLAALVGLRGGVDVIETRGGIADVAHLRRQSPLPETADELCAVARDLKANPREIHLGGNATETEIKRLSASGRLARYKIVHFATHGTLAGQLKGTAEPGLILTPPDKASEDDDGYLSGGEIASLKLDADWVILSACNTAGASGETNAEALSGLARVFFYAGARALLVSHWEVDSQATVKLITSAVGAISRDAKVGRAEALRQAMLALIDEGEPHQAHPAYWAPFVVVGEGAAAK